MLESDEAATLAEWKAAVDAALADPAFAVGMAVIHDLRRMSHVPTPDEARGRVAFLISKARSAGIRRWAVVVSGTAHYGMGRMAQFLSEPSQGIAFRVFREPAEAAAWAQSESEADGAA